MKFNQQLKQALLYISILASVVVYWLFAYQLDRSNFNLLITLFTLSFLAYVLIYKFRSDINLAWLIAIAIVFRLIFLFSIPLLSDDFYRFIWDGQLFVNGINPYSNLPIDVQASLPNKELLISQMNSLSYYSVYPPLNQVFFAISALLSPQSILGSVVVLRLLILLAEVGTLLILPKFLRELNISPDKSLLYALNPLVIVELSGNLHFEALWIFGFLLSIYFLHRRRLLLSSVLWAVAASIKLIPLLLLAVLIRRLKVTKWMTFSVISLIAFGLGFLFFYDQHLITNYTKSLKLYASTFEFNAGVYYVIRSIGYYFVDYNPIKTIGPVLSAIGLLGLFFLLLRKPLKNTQALFAPMLFGLSWYYFFALVVHPWYVVPLVFMSVFTSYRFAILWSFLITTSYYAYSQPEFLESFWLIALEYAVVLCCFIYEAFDYFKKTQFKR